MRSSPNGNRCFFLVADVYEIVGITPHPQFFYPGGKGLLAANLDVPENTDPYLKWTVDEDTVLEGYVLDGTDVVQISVPERDGVYSIKLELFPIGPDPANLITYEYSSSIALEAQFFVSGNQRIELHELYPEENYYSLFHFRGEAHDWGYGNLEGDTFELGDPSLAVLDGLFGFYLDGTTGFQVDHVILPTAEGTLQPFSFSVRFALTGGENAGSLLTVLNDAGEQYCRLGFVEDGDLAFEIGEVQSILAGTYLPAGTATSITVSIIPDGETIRFLWFVNGLFVHDDAEPYESLPHILAGSSMFGGPNGFVGIIDELGIFYVQGDDGPKLDTEVYSRAMKRQFGNDYIFAEGFDGLSVPDQPGIAFVGDIENMQVDGNRILLPPDSRMVLNDLPTDFDSFTVELECEIPFPTTATLVLTGMDSGTELFLYGFDGTVHTPDEKELDVEPQASLRFDFVQTVDGLQFISDQSLIFLDSIAEEDYSLTLSVGSDAEPLGLESVLVTKNRSQLLQQ